MSQAIITRKGGGGSEQPLNGLTLKAKVIESNIEANTWGELVIDDAEATTEYINPADDAEFVVSNIIPGTTDEVYIVKRPGRTVSDSIAIARAKVLEKSYTLISPWQTLEESYFTKQRKISSTSTSSNTLSGIDYVFSPRYRGQIFALTSNKIIILAEDFALTGVYNSSAKTFTFSTTWVYGYNASFTDSNVFHPLLSDIFLSSDSSEIVGVAIQRTYGTSNNYIALVTYNIGVTTAGEPSVTYNNLGFSGMATPNMGSSYYTERWLPINREQRIYGSSYNVIQFNSYYTSYEVLKANADGALLVDISNSKFINRKYYNYVNDGRETNTLPSSIPMSRYFFNFLPNDLQGHNGKVIYLIKRSDASADLPDPYGPVFSELYIVVDYSNLDKPVIVEEFRIPRKYSVYSFVNYSNSYNTYIADIVKPFNSNKMYIMTYISRWDLPNKDDVICATSTSSYMYNGSEAKTVGIVRVMEYDLVSGKIKLLPFIRGLSAQSVNTSQVSVSYDFGFSAKLLPYLNELILYVSATGKTSGSEQIYPDKGTKIIDFNNFISYKLAPLRYNDVNKYYPREKALTLESGVIGDDIKVAFGGY